MQHRILNIILIFGSLAALWGALTSYFLQLNYLLSLASFVASASLMATYYLSRVKRRYNVAIITALILSFAIVPAAWLHNGGTLGRTPLFVTLFSPMAAILLSGVRRVAVIAFLIVLMNGLIFLEYRFDFVFASYPSRLERYVDFALSLSLAIIANAFLFVAVTEHYNKEYLRAKAYLARNQKSRKRLEFLIRCDIMTGLSNRASFDGEMMRLETAPAQGIGIFVVDVDGLKFVNDTLGHQQGDVMLQRAADILRSSFPTSSSIFRIGGDEFVIILPGASIADMEEWYKVLRNNIEIEESQDKIVIPLQLSSGYAVGVNTEVRGLLRDAERKMYREKLFHHASDDKSIIQTVKQMLSARDFGTGDHSDRLEKMVAAFAGAAGVAESAMADIRLFARFHDIGKVGIADSILLKPGPLNEDEKKEMQRHCEIGYRIAHTSPELLPIANLILRHHEWWNGQGYPLGLAGERIPLECRILAISDAYDAMISDRPYRKAMSHEAAVAELRRGAGTQFDPRLADIFIDLLSTRIEV